jgi:deoxyribodipyrimidine photolyase-related protein
VPTAYWGNPSGLACLDRVVSDVWAEGYSHHITRLMVLCNLAALLGISPRAMTDWFWAAYTDAYDWVVEPNVLGMGLYAVGDLMTTKPYVSGAAYIDRMSDYCSACAFDPKTDCPITPLYWAFLARHRGRLSGNPRLRLPATSLDRRGAHLRKRDARVFDLVREILGSGGLLSPERVRKCR